MYDIIIIGAGPAGMTAALYAIEARKKVLILDKDCAGGQILKAKSIKNYPGFTSISGIEYSEKLLNQLVNLDAEIKYEEVNKISVDGDIKYVTTNISSYSSRTIIIATGSENRKLDIPGEKELIGKGVSYCPMCDGMFYKDKTVAIIGGGNSCADGAVYLSGICKKVYVIYRKKEFRSTVLGIQELKENKKIELILNANIKKILGENSVEKIIVEIDHEEKEIKLDGLFIEIGKIPISSLCKDIIDLDDKGYIISNEKCTTSVDGIFVAGDIRQKEYRQLTTAVSDGTIAALNACKYLK